MMGDRRLRAFIEEIEALLSSRWAACVERVILGEEIATRNIRFPTESAPEFAARAQFDMSGREPMPDAAFKDMRLMLLQFEVDGLTEALAVARKRLEAFLGS